VLELKMVYYNQVPFLDNQEVVQKYLRNWKNLRSLEMKYRTFLSKLREVTQIKQSLKFSLKDIWRK
jgi:hypothetical protein